MNYFKKRIAVFLCLLLAIPTLVGVLPMNSLTAEAATTSSISSSYWNISKWDSSQRKYVYTISVEVGQEFNIGKVFSCSYKKPGVYVGVSNLSATYTSSKTSIATVGKKTGIVKAKKKGTTVITIKCKGASVKCTVEVSKKNAFGKTSVRNKVVSKAKAMIKAYNGKMTSKNRYKVLKAYDEYIAQVNQLSGAISNGFLCEKNAYGYYSTTNKLVAPEMWEANGIYCAMYDYGKKINPIGTTQSNWFKIKAVSAKANERSFTLDIKSKVDADDIFAIQLYQASDDVRTEDGRALFRIKVQDTKTGYIYYGWVTANKGSKQLTVNMDYLKLVKGRKYKMYGMNTDTQLAPYGWTGGKTFTVK